MLRSLLGDEAVIDECNGLIMWEIRATRLKGLGQIVLLVLMSKVKMERKSPPRLVRVSTSKL